MKAKLFLLFCMLMSSGALLAQDEQDTEYYPEGTTWTIGFQWHDGHSEIGKRETVEGDTIINGVKFKNVRYYFLDGEERSGDSFAIREDHGKIYCYLYNGPHDGENENGLFMYDFNWEAGKTIATWELVSHDVFSHIVLNENNIDTIEEVELADGNKYQYIPYGQIINGIGKTGEGFDSLFGIYTYMITNGSVPFIASFTRNGTTIFAREHPSDFTGITKTVDDSSATNAKDAPLYSVYGTQVSGEGSLPRGLYIRNGKKFVVK
ncbi:MAG: hypothetical protein IJ196_06680 [Prevotella sp.]|nr:hypothetical protein [Prevotella sp.]